MAAPRLWRQPRWLLGLLLALLWLQSWSSATSVSLCSLFDGANATAREVLNGLHLTVAATPWAPFVIANDEGAVVGGHDIELLAEIASRTGFTYNITTISMREDESSWDEVMYRAAADYDILGQWWMDTSVRRSQGMVIGKHIVDVSRILMTKKPGPAEETLLQSVLTVLAPFSYALWATIICLIACSSLFMWWMEHRTNDTDFEPNESRMASIGKAMWLGFSSLTGQAYFSPRTTAGRIFSVAFSFVMLVTVAAYTANLANFLVMQTASVSAYHTLDDAVRAAQPVCVTKGTPGLQQIFSQYPSLLKHEVSFVSDMVPALLNGSCAVALGGVADLELVLTGEAGCDLHLVGSYLDKAGGGFAVDSRNCKPHLLAVLDAEYQTLHEEGFVAALWKKYALQNANCPSGSSGSSSGGASSLGMQVVDLSGVMLLLMVAMVGTGISSCFVKHRMWRVKSTVRRVTEFSVNKRAPGGVIEGATVVRMVPVGPSSVGGWAGRKEGDEPGNDSMSDNGSLLPA